MRKTKKTAAMKMKRLLVAVAILGGSTMAFQGFTKIATAAEYNKTSIVPTSYNVSTETSVKESKDIVPKGYQKANYTVRDINLEYYRDKEPTSKDISKEEAAELGAQALWSVFGINLEGQVIEMGYQPVRDDSDEFTYPRAMWEGSIFINGYGKGSHGFEIDAVTGEVLTLFNGRELEGDIKGGLDIGLQNKEGGDYKTLAKETAEKLNLVHGTVASVIYNSQGSTGNDPDISFFVKGQNGEIGYLQFSRYDNTLLNVSYNGSAQYFWKSVEIMKQENAKEEAGWKNDSKSSNNDNATNSFIVTED